MFSSPQTKSKAEKLRAYIMQAFESVLGSPVTIEIRSESRKGVRLGGHAPLVLPISEDGYGASGTGEIVELAGTPKEQKFGDHVDIHGLSDKRDFRGTRASETGSSYKRPDSSAVRERERFGEQNQCRSLVRGKVSLAHVIQHGDGSTQRGAWTKRKAVSIAEKLEQENLYVFMIIIINLRCLHLCHHFSSLHLTKIILIYRVLNTLKTNCTLTRAYF